MKVKKDPLQPIKESIQDAAVRFECEPYEVTSGQFWAVAGTKISEWEVRKLGGFTELRSVLFPVDPSKLEAPKNKIRKQVSSERAVTREQTDLAIVLDSIKSTAKDMFSKYPLPQVKPLVKKSKTTKRVVTILLSDLHIGADLNSRETGSLDFGCTEESRRLGKVLLETIEYKTRYRDVTDLNVVILGDIIQNHLHDARDGDLLSEQSCRAIYYLSQFVRTVSAHFKHVTVRFNPGNHGRFMSRHPQRATHQKFDSLERVIYYSIMEASRNLNNVDFDFPKTPFLTYELFDQKFFATHGDTVLNSGNPGKTIKTDSLEYQVNRINAALPDHSEYKAFLLGHVHIASQTFLNNGACLITNGALIPADDFAVSIGIMESTNGQWVFETVPGFAVGDIRFVRVDTKTDKDPNLNKLILPWSCK